MAELVQEIIADDKSHVTALQYSRGGSLLASSGFDTSVKLWRTSDFALVSRLEGHENCANVLLFHPDDSHLITASSDATLRFWDLETGKETKRFKPHSQPIVGLKVLPDKRILATSSYDKTIRFISIVDGSVVGRVRGKGRELGGLIFLDRGSVLMTGSIGDDFSFWSVPGGEPLGRLRAHNGGVAAMCLLRDERTLISVGFDGEIKRWRRADGSFEWKGKVMHKINRKGYYFSALAPLEDHLAVSIDNGMLILRIDSGEVVDELKVKPKSLYCPRYSPDGRYLAAGAADRKIRIWSVS